MSESEQSPIAFNCIACGRTYKLGLPSPSVINDYVCEVCRQGTDMTAKGAILNPIKYPMDRERPGASMMIAGLLFPAFPNFHN